MAHGILGLCHNCPRKRGASEQPRQTSANTTAERIEATKQANLRRNTKTSRGRDSGRANMRSRLYERRARTDWSERGEEGATVHSRRMSRLWPRQWYLLGFHLAVAAAWATTSRDSKS